MTYKDSKQEQREQLLELYIRKKAPASPFLGPVSIEMFAYLPRPDWPQWKKDLIEDIWPTKKPDLDNMEKMIKDVMSGIVYRDDAQVCSSFAMKEFADKPCWEIVVEEISGYRHDIKRGDIE